MNKMTQMLILSGCLTMAACGLSDSHPVDIMTKEQAKQNPTPGVDSCERYKWYGDGVCDDFCADIDPDCEVACTAEPTCPDSYFETEECEAEGSCVEATMCGTTITCSPDWCLTIECEEGFEEVEWCDVELEKCTGAGLTYCQMVEEEACLAYPSCPEGSVEVSECTEPSLCTTEELCGSTITCQEEIVVCDYAPECGEGYHVVDECPTDVDCYTEEVCSGISVSCMKSPNCLLYATCPEGLTEVEVCDVAIGPCTEIDLCAGTVICQ